MFRLTIKELLGKKVRMLSTAMAVLLGVAFLAGTLILTDTATASFDSVLADANAGTDAYVRGASPLDLAFADQRPRVDATLVDELRHVDGVDEVAARVNGYAQIVDRHGTPIGDAANVPLLGSSWIGVHELNPYRIATGRAPRAADEIVIDQRSADTAGFHVGDRATVLTTGEPRRFRISGTVRFGDADSAAGATSVLFTDATAQAVLASPGRIDGIAFTARPGVSQATLSRRLAAVTGDRAEVITGAQLVAEDQRAMHENISSFSTFMLVFAGIAMFVGAFIINNTFSITVAQRTKEMAMLRSIGAGRRQVMRAVILEAAVVGLVASGLGLLAGLGVATALTAVLASMGMDMPRGALVVQTSTVVVSLATGLIVTVVSAAMPALRASRIAPIAALREVALDRSAGSKARAIVGALLVALGVATLLGGLRGSGPALVGLGAVVVFVGVSVLGPVLARPVAFVLGAPTAKLRGMAGSLARENAMRSPRRTARTAASLMIGVGMVAFIMIFAASAKTSMAGSLEHDYHGTHIVDSGSFDGSSGISPDLAAALRTTAGIKQVAEQRVTKVEVDGRMVSPFSGFDASIGRLFDLGAVEGSLDRLGADGIAVEAGSGRKLGDTVTVTFPTGERRLVVRAVYHDGAEWVGSEFVGLEAFAAGVPTQLDSRIYVDTDRGATLERVAEPYAAAEVLDKQGFIDAKNANLDTFLNLVYGMLALAVVIALIGIANTLALSIYERTRELGLLRAVGMSRGQVRASVRWEAVIIALFGTALGLGIGVFFGWAMVRALADEGITRLTIPAGGLLVVTAGAALAGVLTALLPARRAARLDVLRAVSSS
jgi:putative ABC transport system permease protein